jgi:hypothetical protein
MSALREILVQTDAERDVVVDRHRERGRLLEHHADLRAQHVEIGAGIEDVLAVEDNLSGRPLARVERIHPIQRAQQRRLAAARRTDECRHPALGDVEIDVLESMEFSVEEVEMAAEYLRDGVASSRCFGLRSRRDGFEVH